MYGWNSSWINVSVSSMWPIMKLVPIGLLSVVSWQMAQVLSLKMAHWLTSQINTRHYLRSSSLLRVTLTPLSVILLLRTPSSRFTLKQSSMANILKTSQRKSQRSTYQKWNEPRHSGTYRFFLIITRSDHQYWQAMRHMDILEDLNKTE